MRRIVLLLACLSVPTACLKVSELSDDPDAPPPAPTTAAEVLDRHVESLGGEQKLRAIEQRTTEARMIFHAEEGCEEGDENCISEDETGSFMLQNTADGHLYRRTVLGDLVEERGFDGQRGWALSGNGALQIDTDAEALVSREDALLHWYFGVADRGVETALLPPRKEDSDGNVTVLDGIEWRISKDAAPKQLWFDRNTGLLREEMVVTGEGDERQSQTVVYEDYKEVDGVMVPHVVRVTNQYGDREQVVEFITQRVDHGKTDTSKFAIPELPDPEPKPDQLLAQLDAAAKAAKAEPKDLDAQVEHTRLAFAAAHFDEAADAAQAALSIESKEPEALYTLARVQVLSGDYKAAERTLARATKAGVKPEVAARQRAWIHHRRGDFGKLADALDAAGAATMAGRYRSFVGKPLDPKIEGNACVVSVAMTANEPLAVVSTTMGDKTVGTIVDTGAADLILAQSLADELEVTVRTQSSLGKGGPDVGHGQIEAIQIGDLTLSNVPVNVFDDAAIAEMAGDGGKSVKAVLGVGALANFQVTVDTPGSKLEIVPTSAKCRKQREARRVGASIPMWLHETHYIYVTGQLNGAEGLYLVNTGMRGADMTAGQIAYAHAGIGIPPLRSDEAPMVNVDKLSLGDAFAASKLASAFGYFENTQSSDGFRIDGMLGLGTVGRSRFTLDYEQHKIYFAK